MYYDYPEITPHNFKGDFRYNKMNEKVVKFASLEVEARALIEGQFMAKRLHLEKIGYKIGKYSEHFDAKFSFFSEIGTTLSWNLCWEMKNCICEHSSKCISSLKVIIG